MVKSLVFWLAVCGLLLFNLMSQAAIECQAEPPNNPTERWWWRMIDGKKCWYVGRRMIDKSELYWPEEPPYEPDPPEMIEEPPLINRGEFQDRWDGLLDTRFASDPFPIERWRLWKE